MRQVNVCFKQEVSTEPDCYWYHPDHLGSSSWITYSDGSAVQHLHYLPWGEDFVDQRSTNWNAMYTFSAKEKDTETGYSYFGARYYSSDLSIWLSVDPMSDKYPSSSPYTYCANNPVRLVDPNGTKWEEESDKTLSESLIKQAENRIIYYKEQLTKTENSKKKSYYNTCIQILSTQVERIKAMGEDQENTFHFKQINSGEGCVRAKNNNYNYFQIEYKDEAMAFHEIAHYNAYVQKSNPYWKFNDDYGFLGIDYDNPDLRDNIYLANKYWNKEELTAYKAQFLYDPKTMPFRNGKNNYVRNLDEVWNWMKDWSILKPVKENK